MIKKRKREHDAKRKSGSSKKPKTDASVVTVQLCRYGQGDECFEHMTDLGKGGSNGHIKGLHKMTAVISVNGERAGSVEMDLVERGDLRGMDFHTTCDAESRELQAVSVVYCNKIGKPRLAETKNLDDKRGGFLYLDKINIEPKFRGSFVQATALKKILTETKLKNRWSIAVYICEVTTQCTKEESLGIRWRDKKMSSERYKVLNAADARACFRAGFKQTRGALVNEYDLQVFATPEMISAPLKSIEEINAMPVLRRADLEPRKVILAGKDKELSEYVSKVLEAKLKQKAFEIAIPEIKRLISEGASIKNSGVMNAAVEKDHTLFISFFAVHGGSEVLNLPNHLGHTPLTVASVVAKGDPKRDNAIVKKLLELGADKSCTDYTGKTAYGRVLELLRSSKDFKNVFFPNEAKYSKRISSLFKKGSSNDDTLLALLKPDTPNALDLEVISDEEEMSDFEEICPTCESKEYPPVVRCDSCGKKTCFGCEGMLHEECRTWFCSECKCQKCEFLEAKLPDGWELHGREEFVGQKCTKCSEELYRFDGFSARNVIVAEPIPFDPSARTICISAKECLRRFRPQQLLRGPRKAEVEFYAASQEKAETTNFPDFVVLVAKDSGFLPSQLKAFKETLRAKFEEFFPKFAKAPSTDAFEDEFEADGKKWKRQICQSCYEEKIMYGFQDEFEESDEYGSEDSEE